MDPFTTAPVNDEQAADVSKLIEELEQDEDPPSSRYKSGRRWAGVYKVFHNMG